MVHLLKGMALAAAFFVFVLYFVSCQDASAAGSEDCDTLTEFAAIAATHRYLGVPVDVELKSVREVMEDGGVPPAKREKLYGIVRWVYDQDEQGNAAAARKFKAKCRADTKEGDA